MRRPVLRIARFALLALVALALAWFLRTYERFTIPEADTSLEPFHPAGSTVFAVRVGPDEPLARGADVVYEMERDGTAYARFGRVRGLPGDVVGQRDGALTVNGTPIGPLPVPGEAMGEVPDGKVLILATAAVALDHYPDSRRLGFIDRAHVHAAIRFHVGG